MNIKWLEYYLTTASCGSINEAAQKLGISQPALTKAIASLEKEYGITLLKRTKSGIELTPEAHEFNYYAGKVVNSARILDQNYHKSESRKSSRLFLASQNFDFIGETIKKTYDAFEGDLHFCLMEENRNDVADHVLKGEADLGLLVINSLDGQSLPWQQRKKELEFFVLDTSRIYAAVGPKSPLYDKRSLTIQDINAYPALVLDMGGQARSKLSMDNANDGINTSRVLFTNSIENAKYFLMNTDMVMYVGKWSIRFLEKTIHVLSVALDTEQQKENLNSLVLIKHRDVPLSQAETAFAREVALYFGKDPDRIFTDNSENL